MEDVAVEEDSPSNTKRAATVVAVEEITTVDSEGFSGAADNMAGDD